MTRKRIFLYSTPLRLETVHKSEEQTDIRVADYCLYHSNFPLSKHSINVRITFQVGTCQVVESLQAVFHLRVQD